MTKKDIQKIMLSIIILLLFGLLMVTILNFSKNPDDIIIEDTPSVKEELEFKNSSSISEKDIRELLETKKEEFKDFINNIEYYKISEIGEGYSELDDEKYLVLGEPTIIRYQELTTEKMYETFMEQIEEITSKGNIDIAHKIFRAPISIFDEFYTKSAITELNTTEEALILLSATDEKIEAIVNIKLCDETNGLCTRDDKYNYILEKENGIWKIAKLI